MFEIVLKCTTNYVFNYLCITYLKKFLLLLQFDAANNKTIQARANTI